MSRYHYHRRSKKDSPEALLFLLIIFIAFSFTNPAMQQILLKLWYIYFFAFVGIIVWIATKIYHNYKLSKANIDEVDNMSGSDFEWFLCSLFRKLGYDVVHTGRSGDLGCDLVVKKDGFKIAVQAKRYKNAVGPDAVREVVTVLRPNNCSNGIAITNNYFTEEAKYLAQENNIELWNRDVLVNNILKSRNLEKTYPLVDKAPLCPKCNSSMVKRSGKYGFFWGCSRYPQCDGTLNI